MKSKTYFTALIKEPDDGWFYGQIEEVSEAMSQSKNISRAKSRLYEAKRVP